MSNFLDDLKNATRFAWDVAVEGKGPEFLARVAEEGRRGEQAAAPPAAAARAPAPDACIACGGDGFVVLENGSPAWCPNGCQPRKGARR